MFKKIALATAGLAIATTAVFAAGEAGQFDGAINARKSHMRLNAHNLGILGSMAQGKVDYDADAATAAANNLAALTSMSQGTYWPQGSDAESVENTRALKKIWTDYPDILDKLETLNAAALVMQTAAGTDLASLQGAMGALGGACGACHKVNRQSN